MSTAALTLTLAKGLDVLESLADGDEVGLGGLARRVGLSEPTLYRLLATLAARGYVEKAARGRYRLTPKLSEVGGRALRRGDLTEIAAPAMRALTEETREAALLSQRQGDGIVIIAKVECPQPVRVETFVGLRAPLHASAMGKAILAGGEDLPASLPRFTKSTTVARAKLSRELSDTRRRGWAVNRDEWRDGVSAVAMALHDPTGAAVAALSLTVPSARFTPAALRDRFAPALRHAVAAIEAHLARRGA